MSAELAFNRSVDVDYGVAEEVAPDVRRIVANNPGPYTFLGTNSYVVGTGQVAIIDPGPADKAHLQALAAATKGERLTHILITHSHRDDCDGARALQAMLLGHEHTHLFRLTPSKPSGGTGEVVAGRSRGAFRRTGLLALSGVDGVQADAGDAGGFLDEVVGGANAVSGHHGTCGQCETQRVRLIIKVQNDLPRHRTLPGSELAASKAQLRTDHFRRRWRDELARAELSLIVEKGDPSPSA